MSDVKNDFVLFIEVFCHRRENPPEFRFAISIWDINTRDAGNPFLQFVPVPALFCFGSEERNDSCRGMPTEQSFRISLICSPPASFAHSHLMFSRQCLPRPARA